jgi:D-arginine dehydrogenase
MFHFVKTYDIAIIGAGFAGASSAWHLSKMNAGSIIILEQEELPGMHSSGLNASMVRQFEEDLMIAKCVREGAKFIQGPPDHWEKLLNQVGSLLLFKHSRLGQIKTSLEKLFEFGLAVEILSKQETQEKVPLLIGAEFDHAVWSSSDGIVDINSLLWSYLRDSQSKGVELKVKQRVVSIEKDEKGFFVIKAEGERICARTIVNASGAWASELAELAGANNIKLTPFRRHLYTAKIESSVDPAWPFVWDVEHQFYFRPEQPGLLLSSCDEDKHPPGVVSTSHHVCEILAEKLSTYCPSLSEAEIVKEWAGLRTFAKDRRFVIGEDPKLKNFYWAAGLGGCGVASSYAIGRLLADAILNSGKNIPNELKPNRLIRA